METESAKKSGKDIRVELLRFVSCFMVILTHIRVPDIVNGQPLKSNVLVECLSAVCVGMFFLVTGFFLYNGKKTLGQTIRHFAEKTLLPAVLVVFLTLLFGKWLMGEQGLLSCINNADIPGVLSAILKGLLQMSSDYWGQYNAHLWYITEYMKLLLFLPTMLIIIKFGGNKLLLYLAALNLCLCIRFDLSNLYGTMDFIPYTEPFLRPSQAVLLIGYLLYQNREKLGTKISTRMYLFAGYAVSLLWMFYAQMRELTMRGEAGVPNFTTWTSGTGMISTILLAAFVLSLPKNLGVWTWLGQVLLFLGKLSFPIYLLHYAVIIKLETLGVAVRFRTLTALSRGGLVYYATYGLLVFAITALLALVIMMIRMLICRIGSLVSARLRNMA